MESPISRTRGRLLSAPGAGVCDVGGASFAAALASISFGEGLAGPASASGLVMVDSFKRPSCDWGGCIFALDEARGVEWMCPGKRHSKAIPRLQIWDANRNGWCGFILNAVRIGHRFLAVR